MSLQNFIQSKYTLGSKSGVGDPRRKWEDRVFVGEIKRIGGDVLVAGIVADGVGSADFGARGAQLAIDIVIDTLRESEGNDIIGLIESAIESANSAVFHENAMKEGDGLTTLVIVIIYKERCFVGNVGDSRAYWIPQTKNGRPRQVLQLTYDQTYYNIYGGDSNSAEADILVNDIGRKTSVQVDCGFYLKRGAEPDDRERAYMLGLAGLPLKPGDTILLCSDGLIKKSPSGKPYIADHEILDAVQSEYLPDMAAIKLVSFAEGRRPDDNVSAVTIQYLSQELIDNMKAHPKGTRIVNNLIKLVIGVLVLSGFFLLGYFLGLQVH